MNRREFVTSGGALVLTACASTPVLTGQWRDGGVEVDPAAFGESSIALVHHPRLPGPVGIARATQSYSAALLVCTHKKCHLEPAGDRYACPCHGSEFGLNGAVLNGPAEKPLQTFSAEKTESGKILVRL